MFIYPAKSQSVRETEAEAISHVTYLFSEKDGYLTKDEDVNYTWWQPGPARTMAAFSVTSNGAGDLWANSPKTYMPEDLTGGWYDPYRTGTYRTKLVTRGRCIGTGGLGGEHAISDVNVVTDQVDPFNTETTYVWKTVTLENTIIHADEVAPVDYDVDETHTRYYDGKYSTSKFIQFKVNSLGPPPSRYCFTSIQITAFQLEELCDNGEYGWDGAHDATNAEYRYTTEQRTNYAMVAANYTTFFAICRAFIQFDPTSIVGGGRTITDAQLQLSGYSTAEADVIIHEGTQVCDAAGPLLADFDAYTGDPVADVVDWTTSRHYIDLNSTGMSHVISKVAAGDPIKYCLRQYDHDYLDVEPTPVYHRCGLQFSEKPPDPEAVLAPTLKVTYTKVPEWTDRLDTSYWTPVTGSWNGSAWVSAPGTQIWLTVNGTWADNERWSAIKITYTGTPQIDLALIDVTYIYDQPYWSGDILYIPWRERASQSFYDLGTIIMTSFSSFTVTGIDFLEI